MTSPPPILPPTARTRRLFRWPLLVVVAVVIVFGRSVGFDFVSLDDEVHLVRNPYLNPFTAHGLATFWSQPYQGLYIPATYTAWGLLTFPARVVPSASGQPTLDPAIFHLANVALHAANAVLVWWILRRIVGDHRSAAVGALLFALHPVQVEPVAWASGFKDTFSGFWSLLAIGLFLRAVDPASKRPAWRTYAAATAAFAVALCAKPAAVVVPPIAWLLVWASGDVDPKATGRLLLPWLALAVPYVWATHRQQADAALMTWDPPAVRPLVAADALAFYARQLAWPADLAVDYGRTPRWVWNHADGPVAVGLAMAAVATVALLWFARRRGRAVPAGLAVVVVGVGPVLGLVPFIFQQFSTVSDRYLYLPMLGVALIGAWAVRSMGHAGGRIAAFLLTAMAVRSTVQAGVWRDSATLFAHNLTVNPDSPLSYAGLGLAAERANDLPAAEQFDRRAAALGNAMDVPDPTYEDALSRVLNRQPGRSAEARAHGALATIAAAHRLLLLDPDSPLAHRSLARAYAVLGRPADAAAEYDLANRLQSAGHTEVRPPGVGW
jgi:hypothetical protein